jgi:hypothetical protein
MSVFVMTLITLNQICIGFRGPLLLDKVSCQIEAGERIGLWLCSQTDELMTRGTQWVKTGRLLACLAEKQR